MKNWIVKKVKEKVERIKKLTLKEVGSFCWNYVTSLHYKQVTRLVLCLFILFTGLFREYNPEIVATNGSYQFYTSDIVNQTYQVEEGNFLEYPEVEHNEKNQGKGPSFMYSQATDGEMGFTYQSYELQYDMFGRLLMKLPVSEKQTQEAQNIEFSKGAQVAIGSYFYPFYSRYGVDCVGCSGEFDGLGVFANGVRYHKDKGVRQWDGTYKQGITYEGYYIVATDRRIPFCTVLEVTNHRWEGAGIENNVPFQVIVLDRGGVIQGNRFDLFIGLESNMQIGYGKWKTKEKTKATIVKFGKQTVNHLGQRGCKL